MRALGLVALVCALALAGCKSSGTFVVVRIDRGANTPDSVTRIDLQMTLDGRPASTTLQESNHSVIRFPTDAKLELTGMGGSLLVITAIARDASGAEVDRGSSSGTVKPNATITIPVQLGTSAPLADGGGDDMIPVAAAALSVDKPLADLGTVVTGATATATLRVTNTGTAASGALTATVMGTDAGLFVVSQDHCSGSSLAPAASCTLSVVFTAGAPGMRSAMLDVVDGAGASTSSSLSATAVAPGAIVVTPNTQNFNSVLIGQTSSPVTFQATNSGGTTTGVLAVAFTGSNASEFALATDNCTGSTLAPGATCTVQVTLTPASAGGKNASLTISGTPGGTGVATLSGNGETGAGLTFQTPTSTDFGARDVNTGNSNAVTFTLANAGTQNSGAVATTITGDVTQFTVTDNCNGQSVAGLGSCTIQVQFNPTTYGIKNLTISATASPGTSAPQVVTATGTGRDTVTLTVTKSGTGSISATTVSGSAASAFTCSGTTCSGSWYRSSTSATVTVTETADVSTTFSGWGGDCMSSGTNTSCSLTMSAARAATASWAIKSFTLVVNERLFGQSTGSVASSNPTGISCNSDQCSSQVNYNYDATGTITLTATPGSGFVYHFSSGDPSCTGQTCTLGKTSGHTVTITFTNYNYMFVTSTTWTPGAGFASAQTACSNAATAGGLPGSYVPLLSQYTKDASSLLTGARGWLRTDGQPFGDAPDGTTSGIFAPNGKVFHPPILDEYGSPQTSGNYNLLVWTGTYAAGTANTADMCVDANNIAWNSNSSSGRGLTGGTTGGNDYWVANSNTPTCNTAQHLYCFGTSFNTPLTFTAATGRKAFLSKTIFTPGANGVGGADSICQTEADNAGISNGGNIKYLALLASTTFTAASRFTGSNVPFVRTDGVLLATSVSTFFDATTNLLTALDIGADGTSSAARPLWATSYLGQYHLDQLATATTDCSDFTNNTTGNYNMITNYDTNKAYFIGPFTAPCNINYQGAGHLTCLQQQ